MASTEPPSLPRKSLPFPRASTYGGRFRRVPAGFGSAQHTHVTASLRSSISSDQIRPARRPAVMRDPIRAARVSAATPPALLRSSTPSPLLPWDTMDAMDGKAAPTPWRTQLHHCHDAIQGEEDRDAQPAME